MQLIAPTTVRLPYICPRIKARGATLIYPSDAYTRHGSSGNEAASRGDGKSLHLTLETGEVFDLPAERLRAACRCAQCRRAQIDGTFIYQFPSITITKVVPIGQYAVNLEFSDSHGRGIYPWPYLAELGGARSL